MAPQTAIGLPQVPVPHTDFISYLNQKGNQNKPIRDLVEPYKKHDAKLRELFAQDPNNVALTDKHVNLVPVFDGHESEITIRARDLVSEPEAEQQRYIMPLKVKDRKPTGAPAVVPSLKDFQTNFNVFSEQSLVDMSWENVVVAGSAVVTSMIPTPDKYNTSKRSVRQYYHEIVAPASDVDLFLYDLTEEQAIEKIREIETSVKNAILTETTTIRTKNAITIASQYPTRHVQIVLRIYKSVAEILTGFDVDCSCAAYDGKQVYASPRALAAYMTQCNTVDLTRRSPSYENRLSKYSHRGFEVYWPELNRSRVDPSVFERSFSRTEGLARLLVLERLPTSSDRQSYQDQRRQERGRPAINRYFGRYRNLNGNIKDNFEDEVAEWVDEDEVSNYHTFTIPYGKKFHAKKIEKLLYTKDLLLNAEWNRKDDREVNLHRHLAFFGTSSDVIGDCCGFCPRPETDEEKAVAEEEAKIYVSGKISFITDNPGRQTIGSFNPITDKDWTEMAYVGNTARLCQAIVEEDVEHVEDWLSQDGSDPNTRDYTGRTPLHLAVQSSTPAIVRSLVEHGARMIARLADGRTALHLACARGNLEMVRTLLEKSEANEEEEAKKEEQRKEVRDKKKGAVLSIEDESNEDESGDDEVEMIEADEAVDGMDVDSKSSSSFVKVKKSADISTEEELLEEEDDAEDPDVFDINVLAWDVACSPLHLAIANGHVDVVKDMVQTFGADILLPVKLLNQHDKSPRAAIMTLVLALTLPLDRALAMAKAILDCGASCAQADMRQVTALHYYATNKPEALDLLLQHDEPAAKRVINHIALEGYSYYNPSYSTPLTAAISEGDFKTVNKLLTFGAKAEIDFESFTKVVLSKWPDSKRWNTDQTKDSYLENIQQPVIIALEKEQPEIALALLGRGANPNTMTCSGSRYLKRGSRDGGDNCVLDAVRSKIKALREYPDAPEPQPPKSHLRDDVDYLAKFEPGSYRYWVAKSIVDGEKKNFKGLMKRYEINLKVHQQREGVEEKLRAVRKLTSQYEELEAALLNLGAKSWDQLHPEHAQKKAQSTKEEETPSKKDKEYEIPFDFSVADLTDLRREAYIQLFEAAWRGDLDTIKSYTLGLWGPKNDQIPLEITISDSHNNNVFSISVLRDHKSIGKTILEIAQAQYQPRGTEKKRWNIAARDNDDDSEADEENDDGDVDIEGETVNDQFTIENIGEVVSEVKSTTSPTVLINQICTASVGGKRTEATDLWWHAILTDDVDLLCFLIDLEEHYLKLNATEDSSTLSSLSQNDFIRAIHFGRINMLTEALRRTGAGLPLDHLVKASGVKIPENPKYYQGLSVYGKKRKDWASRGREVASHDTTPEHPPLLEAVFEGNIESVEWFLGDAPGRLYQEFAEQHKDEKRVKIISHAKGGFEAIVSKWLGTRNNLALHCAVMAKPRKTSTKLLEYILRVFPANLEVKAPMNGQTPLHLAFSLQRVSMARTLIAAGADQTTRDLNGGNILHSIPDSRTDPVVIRRLLSLVDDRVLSSLFLERTSAHMGGRTPLASWLNRNALHLDVDHSKEYADYLSILRHILSIPGASQSLEMLDGAGETPLHQAVKEYRFRAVELLLEHKSELLYRENATGRTPLDLAEDAVLAQTFSNPPSMRFESGNRWYGYNNNTGVLNRSPGSFVESTKPEEKLSSQERMLRICRTAAEAAPGKRRLVTLNEANEVARRLAAKQARKYDGYSRRLRYGYDGGALEDGEVGEIGKGGDEVAAWVGTARGWTDKDAEE